MSFLEDTASMLRRLIGEDAGAADRSAAESQQLPAIFTAMEQVAQDLGREHR